MENAKLYLGTNGKYYQEHELYDAYFLATGDDIYADETGNHRKRFEIWVHSLIGLSIEKVVRARNLSYEQLLAANQEVLAMRMYRYRNKCTLREAKEAIDKIQEEMEIV